MNAIIDTNALIDGIDLKKYGVCYIPIVCIEELDSLKINKNTDLSYSAKQAIKRLRTAENVEIIFTSSFSLPLDFSITDNKILSFAKDMTSADHDCVLISADHNVILKAKHLEIPCEYFMQDERNAEFYRGFKEVHFASEAECADFYANPTNKWSINLNEYVAFYNHEGAIIDKQKWTAKGFKPLSYKTIDNRFVGKVKPRNLQQEFYMDMLQSKDIPLLLGFGDYGTGKDYCALSTFLDMVDKGKYKRIVWIRNNVECANTAPVGFIPGSLNEKLSVYADILTDFVGDRIGFESLLRDGSLELVHTGFLRGRSFTDSIIYCTEAQNMTKELVQLIISRAGEGSIVFFNGDVKQTDKGLFKLNNGLQKIIDTYKGHKNFACVYLSKCERSELADMASLLE